MKIGFANPHRQTVFQVQTFDVWGNKEDGYDINDVYNSGKIVVNKKVDDVEPEDLIRALKKGGFLRKTAKNSKYGCDWEDYNSWFVTYEGKREPGYPLFRLVNNTEHYMY